MNFQRASQWVAFVPETCERISIKAKTMAHFLKLPFGTICGRYGWSRLCVSLLLSLVPLTAQSCQIEYSDWLISAMRDWGHQLDKRVGNFSSLAECESALRQAVSRSGDPSLANNMSCVGCSARPATPRSSYGQSPLPSPSQQAPDDDAREVAQLAAQEKARQAAFDRGRSDLLQMLKGEGHSSSSPRLRSGQGMQAGLELKRGGVPSLQLKRRAPPDRSAEEVAAAQRRIVELQREVAGIQTLLRQYGKSMKNNSAEFDKWGATVDQSYNEVLHDSKDYVLGLFLQYNLLGNLKKVRKEAFDRLGRLVNSRDPKIRRWLFKELGGRRIDFKRFKKLVELGQGEGDFAGVLTSKDGLQKNVDALILINDLLNVADKGLPDEGAFQSAKMIGETYADLASISYSWFSINRLQKNNAKMAREVNALSFRMGHAMKEMKCLQACTATPGERCLERCTGKTRLSTPPPLLP